MDGMAKKKTRPMPFPLRLPPHLRKRLEALAKADRRTLTNYIMIVLEQHVEVAGKPEPRPGRKVR
jgi:predicted DNA-binding protein